MNRYREALSLYDLSFKNANQGYDKVLSLTYKAICLEELGNYKEAISALGKALTIEDDNYEIYSLLGSFYYKIEDYSTAIDYFTKALSMNPGSAIDYANVGTNLIKIGRKDEAIEYYKMALRIDPGLEYARSKLEEILGGDEIKI
jgi:ribosomal protein S12 methylthiotransferase accessory factor